jgi:hypothetical protein
VRAVSPPILPVMPVIAHMVLLQINHLSGRSEPEFGEPAVIRRARPSQPVKFSISGENRHIVDTCFAATHQAIRIEFPLLVAVCAEPVAGIVVPFVLKANGDAIFVKCHNSLIRR